MPEGETQMIGGIFASRASHAFDNHGNATEAINFTKVYEQIYAEYGLTDDLTLIAAPEFETAKWESPGTATDAKWNVAIAGGVRYRLLDSFGTLSVQASVKSAGTHDTLLNEDAPEGREIELRLLYGTNFNLFRCDGFADVEAGQRWIAGGRANEVPVDLTLGFHVTGRTLLLAQSFNVVSTGREPGLGYYRSHKFELSAVQELGRGFSLQFGGFYAPFGQNSLREEGLVAALWARF